MENYNNAQIKEIIGAQPTSEIIRIADEYIHNIRNREITKRKLQGEPYEPLSEKYGITPRQCYNIVKKSYRIIVQHIET